MNEMVKCIVMKFRQVLHNVNDENWTGGKVGERALGAPSACRHVCEKNTKPTSLGMVI